jgi:hypothetical protein
MTVSGRRLNFRLWISVTCQTHPSCLNRPEGNSPHFPIHFRRRSHLSFFGGWLCLFSRPANFGDSNRLSRGQFDLARLWPGRRGQGPRPNNAHPVRDTAHRSPASRPSRETSRGGLPSACPTALRGSADRSGWITGGTVPSFAPSSGRVLGAGCWDDASSRWAMSWSDASLQALGTAHLRWTVAGIPLSPPGTGAV